MKNIKKTFRVLLFAIGLIVSLSLTVNSQNLAVWDFEGDVNTPSFVETHIIASPAAFGPNVTNIAYYTGNGSDAAYAGTGWPIGDLDPDAYIEFTIAPETGYMMDLTQFQFEHRRSGTGITSLEVRTSLDGFGPMTGFTIPDVTTWFTNSVAPGNDFLGLTVPVTFRIYGYDAESTAGTWRFDNVFFAGTVALAPPLGTPVSDWALGIGIFLILIFTVIRFRRLS